MNKQIFLKAFHRHEICAFGELINSTYSDDLKFIRTMKCENSYIEILSDKGYDILVKLDIIKTK